MTQELMTNLSTLIVKNKKALQSRGASEASIFKSRKMAKHIDNILIYHLTGKTINQLIIDTTNPLDRFDLMSTLESISDAIYLAKSDIDVYEGRIDSFIDGIDSLNIINYDEEAMF